MQDIITVKSLLYLRDKEVLEPAKVEVNVDYKVRNL